MEKSLKMQKAEQSTTIDSVQYRHNHTKQIELRAMKLI